MRKISLAAFVMISVASTLSFAGEPKAPQKVTLYEIKEDGLGNPLPPNFEDVGNIRGLSIINQNKVVQINVEKGWTSISFSEPNRASLFKEELENGASHYQVLTPQKMGFGRTVHDVYGAFEEQVKVKDLTTGKTMEMDDFIQVAKWNKRRQHQLATGDYNIFELLTLIDDFKKGQGVYSNSRSNSRIATQKDSNKGDTITQSVHEPAHEKSASNFAQGDR